MEPELDEPSPPDEEQESDAAALDTPATRAKRTLVAALTALTLLALTALLWSGWSLRKDHQAEDRRTAAVSVADQQALRLLGISTDNVDAQIKELLANSTGDFKRQLAGIEANFGTVVKQGKVASTGQVVSKGLTSIDDKKARVILALTSQVSNADTKTPEARLYRIVVDLAREDGRWLVSGMQFAP